MLSVHFATLRQNWSVLVAKLIYRFHNEKLPQKRSRDLAGSQNLDNEVILVFSRWSEHQHLINLDERLTNYNARKWRKANFSEAVGEALFGADLREAEGCGFDEDMLISTIETR